MSGSSRERRNEIRGYAVGYGLALLLTATAFALVYRHVFGAMTTLGAVFVLGFGQMIVHLRFFLQIGLKRSARDDLQLILFSSLIIVLMVSGTLVLLFNLRARMM